MKLHWQIFIGMLLGGVYGYFLPDKIHWVSWMGELFLRLLKMVIVPLLIASMVSGVTSLGDTKQLGRLGLRTIAWYLTTSLFAILVGMTYVRLLAPGVGVEIHLSQEPLSLKTQHLTLKDFLLRMIPENVLKAMMEMEMLPIIVFSLLLGIFITQVPKEEHRSLLTRFFQGFFDAMIQMTHFIIRFTPYGIFGLLASVVAHYAADKKAFVSLMESLGGYMIVVLLGLATHALVTLPLLTRLIGRFSAFKLIKKVRLALLTAFSTCSSSATMPTTLQVLEENAKVSNRYTSFVIPLGATINMDGTALYECVAAIFVAQLYGIELTWGQQFVVVLTALLASIGAAGIPMAGIVMMTVVFSAVGIPMEGIAIVLTVDRILDMFRTVVNVWSDICGTATIAALEGSPPKLD